MRFDEHRVAGRARRARAARPARRRCAWVEHHRPQLAVHRRRPPGAPRCRARGRPSELASRLRRVDREHRHLLPARGHAERDRRGGGGLADAARAGADADLLALEPVARSQPALQLARAAARARSRPSSGSNRYGSVTTGAPARAPQPPQLRALRRARGGARTARRARAARAAFDPVAARASSRFASAGAEALRGAARSATIGVESHAQLVARARARGRASRSPASPPAARRRARRSRSGRAGTRRSISAWRRIGPDPGDAREGARARAASRARGRWRARPRSRGRTRPPSVRRSSWARSQTLPIVTSSVSPGAAAVRYWKTRLPPSSPASVPDFSW